MRKLKYMKQLEPFYKTPFFTICGGLVLPVANTDAMLVHLWQTLRDMYLANRCYKDYDDIVQAC